MRARSSAVVVPSWLAMMSVGASLALAQDPKPAAPAVPGGQMFEIRFDDAKLWGEIEGALLDDLRLPATTAAYCEPATKLTGAVGFSLRCTPGGDGRVPLHLRGLGWIELDQPKRTISINDFPRIRDFEVAYGKDWRGDGSSRIRPVRGGRLADVLRQQITFVQPDTDAACNAIHQLTLKDIYFGAIQSMPTPQCKVYRVTAAKAEGTIKIVKGCRTNDAAVPLIDAAATCVKKSGAAAVQLTIELSPAFEAVAVAVPEQSIAAGEFPLPVPELVGKLVLKWPFPFNAPTEELTKQGHAPDYQPTALQFKDARGQLCGGAVQLASVSGARPKVPSLKDFRCPALPAFAEFEFQISGAAGAVPKEAFVKSYTVTVNLQSPDAKVPVDLEQLKVPLPVAFPTTREDYQARYGGSTQPGAQLFRTPRCGTLDDKPEYVPFDNAQKTAKWPQWAWVFDSDGIPVTTCAVSKVEHGENGHPILTFDFEQSKSTGPRRLVVVAVGQQLMSWNSAVGQATKAALLALVDAAANAKKARAPLSPINVLFVKADGNFDAAFTGEEAAFDPDKAKRVIEERFPRASPQIPDFALLEKLPEAKKFDRVVVVMDGTRGGNRDPIRVLKDWLDDGKTLALLVPSPKCEEWKPVTCEQLSSARDFDAVIKPIREKMVGLVDQPRQGAAPQKVTPKPPIRRQ